jgi:hypothetical protein
MLRAVPVVEIPIDDAHAPDAGRPQRRRRDGDVVEEAEAHRAGVLGVMAGRAHEREAVVDLAGADGVAEIDEAAGGEARRIVRLRRRGGVGVEHDACMACGRRHPCHVARVVDARELVRGGGARADVREARGIAPPIEQDAQPIGALGMPAARIVREHAIVEHQPRAAGHAATIPSAPTN